MDDDDWFSGGGDAEPEPAPAPAAKGSKKKAEEAPADDAPEVEEAAEEEAAPPPEADPESEYLDPDKLLLFKHWIRPKFLPYKYLTEYRKNYYDDVIDYLDKRNRGIPRDIPVAQTWAERALRSYNKYSNKLESYRAKLVDRKLVKETKISGYRRAIPRPQTWAERILRSNSHPLHKLETFDRFLEDIRLVTRSEISGRVYSYQAMQSVNKRYSTRISY